MIAGVLSLVLAGPGGADDAKKPDDKAQPISKEKLLGKWSGPKGVPVVLDFKDQKLAVKVFAYVGGMFSSTTHDWTYEIDPKTNEVLLQPFKSGGSLGVAKATKDGKLIVTLVPLPPALPGGLDKVTFEFIKPKEPKSPR